jgi:hypothetical protein
VTGTRWIPQPPKGDQLPEATGAAHAPAWSPGSSDSLGAHPEAGDYLAGFCDAVMPARDEGVWPQPRLAELAAGADGLMACVADSIDEASWPAAGGCGS